MENITYFHPLSESEGKWPEAFNTVILLYKWYFKELIK